MDIHRLYAMLWRLGGFRAQRMELFVRTFPLTDSTTILDVGGSLAVWQYVDLSPQVTLLNLDADHDRAGYPANVTFVLGDGCDLPYEDGSFDITHSNSTIEHLHTWENQQRFAGELRRVGRSVWVQAPARGFFLEPHWIAPFIHWLPPSIQRRVARWVTVRGWMERPSQQWIDDFVDEVRLPTRHEMEELFPDCEIHTERWLGMAKSYVAIRVAH